MALAPLSRTLILYEGGVNARPTTPVPIPGGTPSPPPPPPPPAIVTAPSFTGTARAGQTLTGARGTYSNSPTGHANQWQASAPNPVSWADIAGATALNLALTAAEVGKIVRLTEVAANAGGGSGLNPSAASATVTPAEVAITRIVIEGDSITASSSSNGDPDSYARLWAAGVAGRTINNFAVGGSPLSSMAARSAAVSAADPQLLYVLIGANDLPTDTNAYLAQLWAYTDPFRAAGAKIVIGTALPRGAGATNWESKRTPFNAALRAAVGVKIDDVVDFDPTAMGVANAYQNASLYPDELHPSNAGHSLLRRVFAPVMNFWLGIANEPLDFLFAAQAAATPDTDYDSAAYTVAGLYRTESRPYSVGAGGRVSKNGGAFILNGSGTVANGDTLRVRNHSSSDPATQTDVALTIGTTTATYSVTTAGAGSRDWVPTDPGAKLKLWLRPEEIAGAATTQMNTWPDASGNAITVTGAGFGSKPTVVTGAINGLKAVRLDPGYNQCKFTLPAGYLNGRTAGAAFFVAKLVADPPASAFGAPVCGWGSNGDGEFYPYTNGSVYSSYGSNARNQTPDFAASLADWRIASFHAATDDWRYYVDGTAIHTLTSNTFTTGTTPTIGFDPAGGSPFDGQIAEIIDCTSALTTTERQLVEGYLAWKYGLQANLPGGHPHKAEKPTI